MNGGEKRLKVKRRSDRTPLQREACYTLTVYRLFRLQLNGQVRLALDCRLFSISGSGNRVHFNSKPNLCFVNEFLSKLTF